MKIKTFNQNQHNFGLGETVEQCWGKYYSLFSSQHLRKHFDILIPSREGSKEVHKTLSLLSKEDMARFAPTSVSTSRSMVT